MGEDKLENIDKGIDAKVNGLNVNICYVDSRIWNISVAEKYQVPITRKHFFAFEENGGTLYIKSFQQNKRAKYETAYLLITPDYFKTLAEQYAQLLTIGKKEDAHSKKLAEKVKHIVLMQRVAVKAYESEKTLKPAIVNQMNLLYREIDSAVQERMNKR